MSEARPVLLLDVMSTLVTEPFLEAMPRFFGMTLDEFRASRDPKRWVEFEHGRITEAEYVADYFEDGRTLDVDAFKKMLHDAYEWMDGVEPLLAQLHAAGYPMYALSNYSVWYEIIEAKLGLSRYLGWDFVSCLTGFRKPQPQAYTTPIERVGRPSGDFIFVDDRQVNVDAAIEAGMIGILRTPNIEDLIRDLQKSGVQCG
ncbi:MAG: HAD-IA family hydrolase [Myxococcota bacterium]